MCSRAPGSPECIPGSSRSVTSPRLGRGARRHPQPWGWAGGGVLGRAMLLPPGLASCGGVMSPGIQAPGGRAFTQVALSSPTTRSTKTLLLQAARDHLKKRSLGFRWDAGLNWGTCLELLWNLVAA